MFKRLMLPFVALIIASMFSIALAQDPTPTPQVFATNVPAVPTATPEPLPNCPAFESDSQAVRRSYYMGEGTAYLNNGNVFDAVFAYTCVIRVIDTQYVPAYMARAGAYGRQRDYDRAIADYTRVLQLSPSLAAALNNRAVLRVAIGQYAEAAQDFEQVMAQDANAYAAFNNRAVLHMIRGEFDAALAVLEGVVARSDINTVLTAYEDPNRRSEAPAIDFDPAAARALALIGIVHSQKSLELFNDYNRLGTTEGQFTPDQRIISAAGALESRFTFEMRLDDGTWLSSFRYNPIGE